MQQEGQQQSGREAAQERKGCPSCGSRNVSRSHRRGLVDKLLGAMYVRPYRCLECDRRFYKVAHLHNKGGPTPSVKAA